MNFENNNTLNTRNLELTKKIDLMEIAEITPEKKLERIEQIRKEKLEKEKQLHYNKSFFDRLFSPTQRIITPSELTEFENIQIPQALTNKIENRLNKLNYSGTKLATRLAIEANITKEEMENWIKADLIVNKERNNALNGIKEGVSSLISENKEITQRINDREEKITKNTKEIKRLEHSLTILRENNNDLNNKSVNNLKSYQQTLKDLENNKAELEFKINNIPSTANNLISQVKIAEYEAYLANRDKILTLEQNKLIMNEKELLEIKIKDLEIERDCLLTKYQNDFSFYQMDIREKQRLITKLESDLKKHELALADAGKQILQLEKERNEFEKGYNEFLNENISLTTELNNVKPNWFINKYIPFEQIRNNLIKIFFFLTLLIGILIGYYISKLFSRKSNELKIKVGKD